MEIDLTTPALLFSAISLIMLAYTNRFLSYAQLVRTLKEQYMENPSSVKAAQIANLRKRLYLTRAMQVAGIVKARVVYGEKGIEDLSYSPYAVRHVHSLALMQADTIDYTYKSAGREPLNCLFALRGACDDILIVKQGLLTDTSIANIALSDGTHWYTPAHPLLKGTKRAALLEEGILQEKDIRPEDLPSFSTVRLFNAMIDWGELELPVRNIIP